MKCVLLLFILISISAAQDRDSKSPSSGFSYYVSSNWPSGPSHKIKNSVPSALESKESPEQAKEEPRNESPKEPQSNEYQSFDSRDGRHYGGNEDRFDSRVYGYKDDYYKVIGRHGLGFEKRTATADGLRQPITPESLEHIGKRLSVKDLKYVPL